MSKKVITILLVTQENIQSVVQIRFITIVLEILNFITNNSILLVLIKMTISFEPTQTMYLFLPIVL